MYKVGDRFYSRNKRTGETRVVTITEMKYKFDFFVGNKNNYTEDEIREMLEEGILCTDYNAIKRDEIRKLEEKYGIKLKEV